MRTRNFHRKNIFHDLLRGLPRRGRKAFPRASPAMLAREVRQVLRAARPRTVMRNGPLLRQYVNGFRAVADYLACQRRPSERGRTRVKVSKRV